MARHKPSGRGKMLKVIANEGNGVYNKTMFVCKSEAGPVICCRMEDMKRSSRGLRLKKKKCRLLSIVKVVTVILKS